MTILIAEDNTGVRLLLRTAVAGLGGTVWECADGAAAVAAYQAHRPSIVLMDVAMPVMDGLAATKRIRALHASAKVLIVTDYDEPALRQAAREAGACGYLLKQNLLDLAAMIRSILEEGSQAREG